MARIVVTGASRGLGLEFVVQWLRAGHEVAALLRRPEDSAELRALAGEFGAQLSVHACDVAVPASIEAASHEVAQRWDGVDWLVNNAGVSGFRGPLVEMDFDEMASVLAINAIGPLRMTGAFLPMLRRSRDAKVVMITSRMGSIADNSSGGVYAYRMSKAALNMAGRNLMMELQGDGIAVFLMHPGWVQTDMGGAAAPLTITDSVASMIRVLDGLGMEQSGGFYDFEGNELPW